MARPQWSRILDSAVGHIVDGWHGHKAYHLANGRVHLWTRISGDTAVAHPTYNKLVKMVEKEFAAKGYRIDKENRKSVVDSLVPLMRRRPQSEGVYQNLAGLIRPMGVARHPKHATRDDLSAALASLQYLQVFQLG